jgi:hypothetical protein
MHASVPNALLQSDVLVKCEGGEDGGCAGPSCSFSDSPRSVATCRLPSAVICSQTPKRLVSPSGVVLAGRRELWLLLGSRAPRRGQHAGGRKRDKSQASLSSAFSSRVRTKLQKQDHILHPLLPITMQSYVPSFPYPPAGDGVWSPVTSTINWCEEARKLDPSYRLA